MLVEIFISGCAVLGLVTVYIIIEDYERRIKLLTSIVKAYREEV